MEERLFNSFEQVQEYERQRIARELHDTSLQTLTHIINQVELTSLYLDKDINQARIQLNTISNNLKLVIEEIRDNIHDIRPMTFDDLGLKPAIERLIMDMNARSEIYYKCEIDDISFIPENIRLQLYRSIQECITNCNKHSKARNVNLTISSAKTSRGRMITVSVEDDGIGFDPNEYIASSANHFGLTILGERIHLLNGDIDISSEKGKGTKVVFKIPIIQE